MSTFRLHVAAAPAANAAIARFIELTQSLETPFLAIATERLRTNVRRFREVFPGADLFYAVKANAHPGVLAVLASEGTGFEISSEGELDLLQDFDSPLRLLSSNPIKTPGFIRRAAAAGIEAFAVDSPDELVKLARHAPGSAVFVRLLVDNSGSEWPLARKYGVAGDEAVALLDRSRDYGLNPVGTTFHVGSQCRVSQSWDTALASTADVWNEAERHGLDLRFLSIGGGFPVQHTREIPCLEEIGKVVQRAVTARFPKEARLALEPGRAIVGDAAILGATVIGKARRGDQQWLYLDAGVFNALMEAIEGFSYQVATTADGPLAKVVLAGPSCDSVDIIAESIALPELAVGERVYFPNAGAYTLAYASSFNGWPPPTVHYFDDPEL
ncbi:MAG TPA: type III PLP-dependent enzyme [Chloroflexota bacterium]|nr:type III PLP-dependent enzyme [Chloroflexota bacterium]